MRIPENTFKKALIEGKQQYGFWLGLCSPLSAELCGHTGYDWLLIDGEHAPNDLNTVLSQLQAIAGTPAHPVVRLPEGSTSLIKQYLDAGAQTLLIPMVETAEQAQALVAAVRYPPAGVRGVGTALARAARWNMVDDYFGKVDNEICLIVQVESTRGVENLDDILAVEGVDGVFIGPADLAASMGYLGNPAHPDVKAVIEDSTRKVRKAGKAAGTLATTQTASQHYESVGMQFIALGVDTMLLAASAKSMLKNHLDRSSSEQVQQEGNGAY